MKIDFTKDSGALNVSLDGRLDTTTAPELEGFLCKNYEDTTSLVINCEKLSYVSSAGLRVLLTANKRLNGALQLTNVCELVTEVFEMTGFADILEIK